VKKDFGKDEDTDTHIISECLSEPSFCSGSWFGYYGLLLVAGLVYSWLLVYYWLLVWFIIGYWFILGLFSLFNVQ
jgi:hypothetical protein